MRRRPNDGLATTVTTLMIGIAIIGAIDVGSKSYEAYCQTKDRPNMAVFRLANMSDQMWDFRSAAEKQQLESKFISRMQAKEMEKWQARTGTDIMKLMGCGLLAAGGVLAGRMIRGKQPQQGTWRSR